MSFNTIRENKILAEISDFKVLMICLFTLCVFLISRPFRGTISLSKWIHYIVRSVLHSKRRPKIGFKTDYHLMQVKSIAKCSKRAFCNTFNLIKLPFVLKTFVLSIFEWSLKTGFTVQLYNQNGFIRILVKPADLYQHCFQKRALNSGKVMHTACLLDKIMCTTAFPLFDF